MNKIKYSIAYRQLPYLSSLLPGLATCASMPRMTYTTKNHTIPIQPNAAIKPIKQPMPIRVAMTGDTYDPPFISFKIT